MQKSHKRECSFSQITYWLVTPRNFVSSLCVQRVVVVLLPAMEHCRTFVEHVLQFQQKAGVFENSHESCLANNTVRYNPFSALKDSFGDKYPAGALSPHPAFCNFTCISFIYVYMLGNFYCISYSQYPSSLLVTPCNPSVTPPLLNLLFESLYPIHQQLYVHIF